MSGNIKELTEKLQKLGIDTSNMSEETIIKIASLIDKSDRLCLDSAILYKGFAAKNLIFFWYPIAKTKQFWSHRDSGVTL